MEKIEINGIYYERIETEKPKKSMGKGMMALLSMAVMASYPMYGESKYDRSLPAGINLVKEFELIQLKKSKLSKWDRDMVVKIFHQRFRIAPPDKSADSDQGL